MRRIWVWTPPLAILCTIIWLSHQPVYPFGIDLPSPLDKFAHAAVFGSLAFFIDLAGRHSGHRWPLYRRHLWIFLGVAFFAATDEWHQYFIPGRDCSFLDWLADIIGATLGLSVAVWPFLLGKRDPYFGWWRGTRERPDPERPLVIVADPHWGEELTGLREATRKYPDADWLFLGDIFDVWAGLPGLETEPQRSFLWWVQERRDAHRWIGLWMGNRDYFLDRLSKHFDLIGEGIGGDLPKEGLSFEHGDLVNGADRRYRFWNLVSRSAFMWFLISMLPPFFAQKIIARLEKAMRMTNADYRVDFPRTAFAQAASEHAGTTFITGHFHTHEEEGNGVSLPWAHEGRFVLWHEHRLEFLPQPFHQDATFSQETESK